MKRALIYLSVVALALAAIYWSVNQLSHFVDADDDTVVTPVEGGEAVVAEQPTIAPPPTLEPSPIPPSPLPPTAVPPTVVPPTEVPTLVPATEVPTIAIATEVIAPTSQPTTEVILVDVAPTTEVTAPTQGIEPTVVPATDMAVSTDVLLTPGLEPTLAATVELSPTFVRGEGLETTPIVSGGQSSVDSPVAVPPTTEPILLPTATIFELQPTVVVTSEQPIIEPTSPVLPTTMPSLVPSLNPEVTPILAQIIGTISPATAVNLTLTLPDGTTVTGVTESDGTFVFPNLQPGAYHLEASAEGFLTSGIDFTLTDGQIFALPPAVLTAGDTNADNTIDVRDAVLIAANFGGPPLAAATDLNGDGWIDIRDLAIIGAVFGESGPVPWG